MLVHGQGHPQGQGYQAVHRQVCTCFRFQFFREVLFDIQFLIYRNIVDASALRDIKEASALDNYTLPKLYIKQYYCIEAAVHQRIVRVRSNEMRKNRDPPARARPSR